MFSTDLESGFKGMFLRAKVKNAENLVELITRMQSKPSKKGDKKQNAEDPLNSSVAADSGDANPSSVENDLDGDNLASSKPLDPRSDKFHEIARRRIVREWPRDPNGQFMDFTPTGKFAGNDQPLWGATVLDFYMVRCDPQIASWLTVSTGSKLAAYVKSVGEITHAKDEIAWAEQEPDPRQLFPCGMGASMRSFDLCPPEIRRQIFKMPIEWIPSPNLESRIPLYLLPQKLIVHDPTDTLRVNTGSPRSIASRSTPQVYRLKLTPEALAAAEEERARVSEAHKSAPKDGRYYLTTSEEILAEKTTSRPVIEPVFAQYPAAPQPPLSTPEAHLYLNKDGMMGIGHHSQVFRAIWDLPRNLLEQPYVCSACFEAAFLDVLRQETSDVVIDETEPLGHQIGALLIAIATKHGRTGILSTVESTRPGTVLDLQGHDDSTVPIPFSDPQNIIEHSYQGTTRTIPVPVKWTTPGNYCIHEAKRNPAEATFKVSIAAKLSVRGDAHLEKEAVNYQGFPGHFFEHWSGYNVVRPNRDPTPALAIVPQFYGYYVPEESETDDNSSKVQEANSATVNVHNSQDYGMNDEHRSDDEEATRHKRGGKKEYLSPIMLLEDCGTPIEVDKLNIDDRHECAALLFRMHAGGWVHGSFYPRNVLMSYGDITEWPGQRASKDRRFRLIDFGRSMKTPTAAPITTARGESWECQKMFHIVNGRF